MADDLPVRERLTRHVNEFLAKARTLRTWLQVFTITSSGLVAIFKAAPTSALKAPWPTVIATLEVALLVLAALVGLLVLFTDKPAAAVMADAQDMSKELDQARTREAEQQRLADQLQKDVGQTVALALTVDSMRTAVDVALYPGAPSMFTDHVEQMLELLVVSKQTLFGMGDELWNFSVYLWRPNLGELECVACRRPARGDENAEHRRWAPGEGHIGKAFQMRRALICADSTELNVRGFFDAPDHKVQSYDDTQRYRSLAAIPFTLPGQDVPAGVVVATSDVENRFRPTVDGEDCESVRPIRALGKTLATLLAVTNLRIPQEHDHADA